MKKVYSPGAGGGRHARKYLRRAVKMGGAGHCEGPRGLPHFVEIVEENLKTSWDPNFGKTIDISVIKMYSMLVLNTGSHPVVAQTEMSPDGLAWGAFGELAYVVEAGGKRVFVPQCFLRYVRVKYRSWRPGHDTYITIWFQGQS